MSFEVHILQYVSIGSDNDLVLIRQKSIAWTNDDQDIGRNMVSLSHNEISFFILVTLSHFE